MQSSYKEADVQILLKDITGRLPLLNTEEREKRIQSGVHYSEMLPLEYIPTKKYMGAYNFALNNMSAKTASAVSFLAEQIFEKKGENTVIVSLARAGIPAGILVKRYLNNKYGINVPHYAISIIRGRGIDKNAVDYILKRHRVEDIQFIDGWVGKGAIARELEKAVRVYPGLSAELAAVSDPSGTTNLAGTYEDLLIPSALLNSTVTGLISRTVLNSNVIGENDFHGAAFYSELKESDLSNDFLDEVSSKFNYNTVYKEIAKPDISGIDIIYNLADKLAIDDINFIKPGIGEATRVLLRRTPDLMFINENYRNSPDLNHLYALAEERGVRCEISPVPLNAYKAVGIIKKLKDI